VLVNEANEIVKMCYAPFKKDDRKGFILRLEPKEAEVIRQLTACHNIHVYEVEAISEGKQLPGGTFPGELQSMSGYIITPTTVYNFWFDWVDGHYSLGEEDGNWGGSDC
jgi:hypothetical protein